MRPSANGLEGIVAKRHTGIYRVGLQVQRSETWRAPELRAVLLEEHVGRKRDRLI